MAFHCSLESFAFRDSADINVLSWNEVTSMDLSSDGQQEIFIRNAEFSQQIRRGSSQLFDVTVLVTDGFGNVLGLAFSGSHAHGTVPMLVHGLVPDDDVPIQPQHGARMSQAPFIPNRHHSEFDGESSASAIQSRPQRIIDEPFGVHVTVQRFLIVRLEQWSLALSRFPIGILLCLRFCLHLGELFFDELLLFFLGQWLVASDLNDLGCGG
mmetsp:Transcript_14332/g.40788  ORF Transcript_14332/g.40788 Transcript_14332/m.40788 type:complete len:211 (-) Transcript_14332:186-818(-)